MYNQYHIKFRASEKPKGVPLLLSFLYIARIRESASSSFERAATRRKRVLWWTFLHLIEKKIGTSSVLLFHGRLFSVDFPTDTKFRAIQSTHITIGRSLRSLSLSLSKRCNEISMKNLAREYHWARASTREKLRYVIDSRAKKKTYDFAMYKTSFYIFA